ncbi:MAG: hypothetical protein BWY72_00402 [Bacteroidetes bacterium ADurb.Bin416]|nr:MAG: hypothetical protein BWY72_00402 [Bacteroidetes bacterium ADurb.Bin416]
MKEGGGGFHFLDVGWEGFDLQAVFCGCCKRFPRSPQANPSLIQFISGEVVGKGKIASREKAVFARFVGCDPGRHFQFGFHGYQAIDKYGESTRPIHGQNEGFTAGVDPVLFVGTDGQKDAVIGFVVRSQHQVGVTGPIHLVGAVFREMTLCQDGVAGSRRVWSFGALAAEDHFAVPVSRSTFGTHQVVHAVLFVDVGGLNPDGLFG